MKHENYMEYCIFIFSLIGMVPTACALFPQFRYVIKSNLCNFCLNILLDFSSIKLSTLEKYENAAYCDIVNNCKNPPAVVYCNKGL